MNITTQEYKGYTIKIESDDDPLNPCKEWDMLGTMVFWHRNYNLGHEYERTRKMSPGEWLLDWLEENRPDLKPEVLEVKDTFELLLDFQKTNLVVPVYAYEHGGITIKARSKGIGWDSWDSGQLGFIYISHDKIKKEYSAKRITKKLLERISTYLVGEIESYDDYLTGNVYGFIVEDTDEEHLDSCWGFYGDDGRKEALSEAKGFVDWKVEDDVKQERLINVSFAI